MMGKWEVRKEEERRKACGVAMIQTATQKSIFKIQQLDIRHETSHEEGGVSEVVSRRSSAEEGTGRRVAQRGSGGRHTT